MSLIRDISHLCDIPKVLSPSIRVTMAPTPAVWNPLSGVADFYVRHELEEVVSHTLIDNVMGGLATIMGFAGVIALVVEKGFKLPKWPFTKERWNPKPNVDKEEKTDEVTKEDILDHELTKVAGGLRKRDVVGGLEGEAKGFVDRAKNQTERAVEQGKYGFEEIKEGFEEIVEKAEEVGKEIWEDIKGIFDQGENEGNKTDEVKVNSTARRTRHRRAFNYVS